MSNKILEECLIEFRRLLKEWRDEIAARREQQLVSLSSSPPTVNLSHKFLTENQTPKTQPKNHSTGYVYKNPSKPPKTPSQIHPQKTHLVAQSSPKSPSPQTVSYPHPSPPENPLEKQPCKDPNPNDHNHSVNLHDPTRHIEVSPPQTIPSAQPPPTTQRKSTSRPNPTRQTQTASQHRTKPLPWSHHEVSLPSLQVAAAAFDYRASACSPTHCGDWVSESNIGLPGMNLCDRFTVGGEGVKLTGLWLEAMRISGWQGRGDDVVRGGFIKVCIVDGFSDAAIESCG
ncbi:hypothetical protein FH972_025420 [Carpinus fangiana]|uniref:Uncharacterized protein n=1 Tax=Carpinus fangiana TaxID=176857 RepID=A0A5N6L177_9ROSI|nr:hypothetical protein FH972_025420 [Carpinus fangiana]